MNTWHRPWHRALGSWADRQADAVIAVATNVATAIQQRGVRARIIRNGIPIRGAPLSSAEVASVRAKFGVPPEAYLISFVGRFTKDKNPLLFVEVAAVVAERCPNAYFLLIGDGPLRPAAEARGRALGVDARLNFAGFQPNAAQLHQVADVLAVTSDSEGSPLSVLEAMRAYKPVVATAVGDIPFEVADGATGFVIPRRDVHGLADALVRLADPSLRRVLGRTGHERLVKHFSIERTAAETSSVYREVIQQRTSVQFSSDGPAEGALPSYAEADRLTAARIER
jgi:glycosyltransferase involved in cell wall biosynthesis